MEEGNISQQQYAAPVIALHKRIEYLVAFESECPFGVPVAQFGDISANIDSFSKSHPFMDIEQNFMVIESV